MSRTYKDKRKRIYFKIAKSGFRIFNPNYLTDYLISIGCKLPTGSRRPKRIKRMTNKTLRKRDKGKEIPSGGHYKKLHDRRIYE